MNFYVGLKHRYSKTTNLLLLLTFLISQVCYAQNFLLLEKKGTTKRIKIGVNEVISYKTKGLARVRSDKIVSLRYNIIEFSSGFLLVDELSEVIIRKIKRQNAAGKIMIFGAGYFAFDQFNNSVIMGNSASFDGRVNRTASVIIGGGLLIYMLSKRKIKIRNNGWQARIQDFDNLNAIE